MEVIQDDPATRQRAFKFLPGPVFSNIVLADGIHPHGADVSIAIRRVMALRAAKNSGRFAWADGIVGLRVNPSNGP